MIVEEIRESLKEKLEHVEKLMLKIKGSNNAIMTSYYEGMRAAFKIALEVCEVEEE